MGMGDWHVLLIVFAILIGAVIFALLVCLVCIGLSQLMDYLCAREEAREAEKRISRW